MAAAHDLLAPVRRMKCEEVPKEAGLFSRLLGHWAEIVSFGDFCGNFIAFHHPY
jgi:hypothetical protein